MQKQAKITLILTTLILFTLTPLTSAAITNNYNIPYIDQWTNARLDVGTYTNITRIDGVWYLDGKSYPEATLPPNTGGGTTPVTNPTEPERPIINPSPTPTGDQGGADPTTEPSILDPASPYAFLFIVVVVFVLLIAGVTATSQNSKKRKNRVIWTHY